MSKTVKPHWPDEVRLKMIEKSEFYSEPEIYQYGFYDGFQHAQSKTQELQEQNREIVESNESLTGKLKEAKLMLGRLRRSMSVHPDCTSGSEFDDYTTNSQNLEDEIEELLTKHNHLKSNTNGKL